MNKGGGGGDQQQFLIFRKASELKKTSQRTKKQNTDNVSMNLMKVGHSVTSQIKNQILKTEACGHLIEKLNLHYRLPNMISHLFCIPQGGTDNTEVDNAHVSTCSRFSPWLQGHVVQHISCTNHARCPRWYLNTRKTDLNTRKTDPTVQTIVQWLYKNFSTGVFFISLG
jgi:hypothetical protein